METDKKPYEPPAIVYSEELEAVAGFCDAASPFNGKAGSSCTTLNS